MADSGVASDLWSCSSFQTARGRARRKTKKVRNPELRLLHAGKLSDSPPRQLLPPTLVLRRPVRLTSSCSARLLLSFLNVFFRLRHSPLAHPLGILAAPCCLPGLPPRDLRRDREGRRAREKEEAIPRRAGQVVQSEDRLWYVLSLRGGFQVRVEGETVVGRVGSIRPALPDIREHRASPRLSPAPAETCRLKKLKCDGLRPHCTNCLTKFIQGTCVFLGPAPPPDAVPHPADAALIENLRAQVRILEAKLTSDSSRSPSCTSSDDSRTEDSIALHSLGAPIEFGHLPGVGIFGSHQARHMDYIFEAMARVKVRPGDGDAEGKVVLVNIPGTEMAAGKEDVLDDDEEIFRDMGSQRGVPTSQAMQCGFARLKESPVAQPHHHHPLSPHACTRISLSNTMVPLNFIHRATFLRNAALTPKILRLAICAFAARFSPDPRTRAAQRVFYTAGRKLASAAVDSPSVADVQALLLLAETGCSK
ncbi:hypothetical protein BDK51DRAFT_47094 [Blyttiomyces helicus]|uniref:Zn(2)-C6 fungal-type domain-containing protein n=1 Tax=Blyttiomyces helicus TaxID=388810 RepID=A0A4P9W4S7_9FUNG|nr:hypothetical protein BDK51DRAFT_47094 [Blyttiomyces helicus]|eukprot:RKO86293.1 hypothetical protein BDK51DRAFT_47094 [Blyttiomyces helicus]